jgi:bifunctional DNA-binding transcriptional regulator/antitoxin component of YhaV-PrlF toxin-antitoxin module
MQPTNEETKSWICDVDEEGILIFPDELWDLLGWKEGDTVEFLDNQDGTFSMVKVNETISTDQPTSTISRSVPDAGSGDNNN